MRILPFVFIAPLMGCTSLVMSTVMALDDLDPMTADPAGFSVALDVPAPLAMVEDKVFFEFAAVRGETGDRQGGRFVLAASRDDAGRTVYRLPPEGIDAVRAAQQDAATWAGTGDNELSIGVTVDFCRTADVTVPDDIRFSIFIQLAQDAPMLPLVRNSRVTEVIEAQELDEIGHCGAT